MNRVEFLYSTNTAPALRPTLQKSIRRTEAKRRGINLVAGSLRRSITLSHESRAIMNYAIGFCITGNRVISRGELVALIRGSYTIIWGKNFIVYARTYYGKTMRAAASCFTFRRTAISRRLMKIRYIIRNTSFPYARNFRNVQSRVILPGFNLPRILFRDVI